MKRYLVFDWGGTSLKYAYMSEDGQIIQKESRKMFLMNIVL